MAEMYMYFDLFLFWMVFATSVIGELSVLTNIKGSGNVDRKWAFSLSDKQQDNNGPVDLIIVEKEKYDKLADVLDNKQIQKGYELNEGGLKVYKDNKTGKSIGNIGQTPSLKSWPGEQEYKHLPVVPSGPETGIPERGDNRSYKLLKTGKLWAKHVLSNLGFRRVLDRDQASSSRLRRQADASGQITTTIPSPPTKDLSPLSTYVTSASPLLAEADNTEDTRSQTQWVQATVVSTNKNNTTQLNQSTPTTSNLVSRDEHLSSKPTLNPLTSSTHLTTSIHTHTEPSLQSGLQTTTSIRPQSKGSEIITHDSKTKIVPVPEATVAVFTTPKSEPKTTEETISSESITPGPEPEGPIQPEPETTTNQPKPEITIQPEPEITIQPEPETTIQLKPETTIQPEPETTIQPEPEITIQPEPEITIQPEPETTIQPEPTIQPKPESTMSHKSETTVIKSKTSAPRIIPFIPQVTKSDVSPSVGMVTTESRVVSEPEPTSENAVDIPVFAEPGPDWVIAKNTWKEAWDFLVYFYGVVFLLLAAFTIVSTVRLWRMNQLLSRHYFLTLNILISIVCVLRGFYWLLDAHNVEGTFHNVLDYFLYSTVFPCLTSAFSILFYALLHATRIQVMSPKIQKLNILVGIIGFHFCFSFLTDITVGLMANARILLFICQLIFVLWGALLSGSYIYLFRQLYKSALKRQKALMDLAITASSKDNVPRYTLSLGVKITFIIAICGLFCIVVELYGIFCVYQIFSSEQPKPWPWWTYHFCMRSLELVMCLAMAYVAAQPFKYTQKAGDKECLLYCAPFNNVLCHFSKDNSDLRLNNMERSFLMKPAVCQYSPPEIKLSSNSKIIDSTVEKTDASYNRKVSMLVMEAGLVRFRREDELYNKVNIFDEKDVNSVQNGNAVPDKSFDDGKQMFGMKKEPLILEAKDDINIKIGDDDKSQDAIKTSDASESSSVGISNRIPSMNLAASLEWEFDKVFQESFTHEKDVDSVKSFPGMVHSMLDSDLLNASLDTDFSDQDGLSDIERSPNIKLDTSTSSDSSSCDTNSKKVAKKPLLKKLHRSKSDNPDIEDTKCKDGSKYKSLTTVDSQQPVVPRGFCVVEPSKSNAIDELKRFSFYVNNKIS